MKDDLKPMLQKYFELQRDIYRYFGYVEEWRVYPLDDQTDAYWLLLEDEIIFYDDYIDQDILDSQLIYRDQLHVDEHQNKSIWEGADYSLVMIDTKTDDNIFLAVFDNKKRIDPQGLQIDL